MPQSVVVSHGIIAISGAPAPAPAGPPAPLANPLVIVGPFQGVKRFPDTVQTITVEQWGEGGNGHDYLGTGTAGNGGGSGAYAKYTMGAGLFTAGAFLNIVVGGRGPDGNVVVSGTGVHSSASNLGVTSGGGFDNGNGGANVTIAGAGLTTTTLTAGVNGNLAAGAVAGDGGDAPNGGAGGKGGGGLGVPGKAGGDPGGGGGGAGPFAAHGIGGQGKLVITY